MQDGSLGLPRQNRQFLFCDNHNHSCGVLWISGTMNSGHVAERVCVHVCVRAGVRRVTLCCSSY